MLVNIIRSLIIDFKKSMHNFSDRFIGIKAGTRPPGNDPTKVYEAIRNYGVIPEEMLPFSDDLKDVNEYYSFKGANEEACNSEGKKFLEKYVLKHEYLPRGLNGKVEVDQIRAALKLSPVALAVQAWSYDVEKQKFVRTGNDTHWTECVSVRENGDLVIEDSYEPFTKILDKDFGIFWAKKIWIGKREKELSLLQKIVSALSGIVDAFSELVRRATATNTVTPPVIDSVPIEEIPEPDLPPEPGPEKVPAPIPVKNFALAIQRYEGYYAGSVSFVNHNPGNMKYTDLTRDLGALRADSRGFCVFASYADGLWALCRFITLAKQNKLKSYKNCTVRSFIASYAPKGDKNDPERYARTVAGWLGVSPDALLATLLE
jgi:hypothetical protein